nr:hypothetical protein [Tanacetum cinerariifolium]
MENCYAHSSFIKLSTSHTLEGVLYPDTTPNSVTAWVVEGGRIVLCYVQGSGRRKRKKGVGCGSRRQENHMSRRWDCGRIRIWDLKIKRVFRDNTLRTSEEAPPVIKGSLDANEDIGVVEVSSAIDDNFDIEVVVGGGEASGVGEDKLNRVISALKDEGGEFDGRLDEINLNLSKELADNGVSPIPTSLVAHERVGSVTAWVAEGDRMVLCYVQGNGRRKRKKGVGCSSGRQENHGSGRRNCGRIMIWDPRIKRVFQDNTLRTRWFRKSGE